MKYKTSTAPVLLCHFFILLLLFSFPSTAHGRALQNFDPIWDIAGPEVSYNGMQLDLDYRVRDQVRAEYVSVDLFEDDDCTRRILPQDNNYITIDIVNDLTPFGQGAGSRTMTLNLNIDPTTVSQSPVISFNSVTINGETQAVVSFCTRFSLWDPDDPFSTTPARSNDYIVAVGVDLTENIGITGLITDQEDLFRAEAFECDEENNPIDTTGMFKNQGDRIRICVRPDEFARDFGAVMKSINSLALIRGDVRQDVLVPQGVVRDLIRTDYRCIPGQQVCTVDAVVSNDFYYSTGTVFGTGQALLQYSFDIRGRKLEKAVSVQRRAREPGGAIGGRSFGFEFQVEPSRADYDAVAFECDGRNRPLTPEQKERLRLPGEQIRVCVMPNLEAVERGVYVRAIASFFFEQGDIIQFAVEPTAKQASDGDSLVICYAGQPLCAFKMRISENFFNSWDPVVGTGEIYLQFGNELRPLVNRRAEEEEEVHRQAQITDAGFAGAAEVSIIFNVDPTYVPPKEKTWQEKVNDWWLNTPLFLRIVYIIALIVGIGILFCVMYGMFCGWDMVRKEKKEEPQNPRVIVQPIYVAPDAPKDVADGERDFCDCLSNPESYYFEADVPQEQPVGGPRSVPTDVPGSVYMDENATLPSKFPEESMRTSPKTTYTPYTHNEAYSAMDDNRRNSGRGNTNGLYSTMDDGDYTEADKSESVKSPKQRKDSLKSPRRKKSKSPKPERATVGDDGIRVSNHSSKSPRSTRSRKTVNGVDDDGIRVSNHSSKSPRSARSKKAAVVDDDGIRVSNHSSKSPRSARSKKAANGVDDDGIRVSNHSKSPKKRKKRTAASATTSEDTTTNDDGIRRSPRPGTKRSSSLPEVSSTSSSIKSPKTKRSSSTVKSPKSAKSTRSPGGRKATLDDPTRSRRKKSSIDAPPF